MTQLVIPDVSLRNNNSQRLACVLVLDGSSSMAGQKIAELNKGLARLEQELKNDDIASLRVQVSVIRFGDHDNVSILTDWIDAMGFSAPLIDASGSTPMGAAVKVAMQQIEDQKKRYREHGISYNRPWLFLITDGAPTDPHWQTIAEDCRRAEENKKFVFYGIGVEGADLQTLGRFSSARPPLMLRGLEFQSLFRWLSQSAIGGSRQAPDTSIQMARSLSDWAQVPG